MLGGVDKTGIGLNISFGVAKQTDVSVRLSREKVTTTPLLTEVLSGQSLPPLYPHLHPFDLSGGAYLSVSGNSAV